jgi:hypothetical protein
MAYFIIRSWGNYLFFPHPDIGQMYPFFKGQGGVYKVFDSEIPFPFYNGEIFRIFGAPTIGSGLSYHEDFLIEEYGVDYADQDLKLEGGIMHLQLPELKLTFYDLSWAPGSQGPYELSRLARIE